MPPPSEGRSGYRPREPPTVYESRDYAESLIRKPSGSQRPTVGKEWEPETIFDVLGSERARRILSIATVRPVSADDSIKEWRLVTMPRTANHVPPTVTTMVHHRDIAT